MRRHFLPIVVGLLFVSCTKEEPLNNECDIEKAWVSCENPLLMFSHADDTLQIPASNDTSIFFSPLSGADLTAVKVCFQLTPGATISPANGSSQDFSNGAVTYTVTSQDRQYQRHYQVKMSMRHLTIGDTLRMGFEYYQLDASQSYYEWYELMNGEREQIWGTANAGYKLTNGNATPDQYPTAVLEEGYKGHAVKLTTCSTGAFGAMVRRPIAGGSIFLGSFDMSQALTQTLKCTIFGYEFNRKPLKIKGYYKYQPGPTMTDVNGNVLSETDDGSIFAVLYKSHDEQGNPITLYGNDIHTNPNIVARCRIDHLQSGDNWVPFEMEMTYEQAIDYALLANWGYKFTLAGSSSAKADTYKGAVGSILCLDEFEVICEKEKSR